MCFIIRGVIRVQQDVLKEREKEIEKRGGFIFCGWEFCTLISGMLEDSEGKMIEMSVKILFFGSLNSFFF